MEGLEECCSRCTTAAELPSPLCNGDQKYKQSSDHRPTTFFSSSFSQSSRIIPTARLSLRTNTNTNTNTNLIVCQERQKNSNWAATLRSSQIGWSMFWRDSHPLTRLHTQSSGIKHIERVFTQFTTVNYLLAWFKENPSGHFILVWSVSENCFRWISSKQEWVFDNIVILAIDQLMLSIYAFG